MRAETIIECDVGLNVFTFFSGGFVRFVDFFVCSLLLTRQTKKDS